MTVNIPEMQSAIPELPAWLSCFPEKLNLYRRDPAFLQGWFDVLAFSEGRCASRDLLWNMGSILLKTDSVISNRAIAGINAICRAGYSIDYAAPVEFDEVKVQRLWEHSLGRYSPERVSILSKLMSMAPSIYISIRLEKSPSPLPVSTTITRFKGEAEPDKRRPGQLRYEMGAPKTGILNMVHSSDEPADVVREMGLLLDAKARQNLLASIGKGAAKPYALTLAENLCADAPHHDLDITSSTARIKASIARLPDASKPNAEALLSAAYETCRPTTALQELGALLTSAGHVPEPLDMLVISAHLAPLKRAVKRQPFPSVEEHHWIEYMRKLSS